MPAAGTELTAITVTDLTGTTRAVQGAPASGSAVDVLSLRFCGTTAVTAPGDGGEVADDGSDADGAEDADDAEDAEDATGADEADSAEETEVLGVQLTREDAGIASLRTPLLVILASLVLLGTGGAVWWNRRTIG